MYYCLSSTSSDNAVHEFAVRGLRILDSFKNAFMLPWDQANLKIMQQ